MARILYGVHGTGRGHAMRALTVARGLPEHEFLFISDGQGADLLRREYPVVEVPGLTTVVYRHRVAVGPTIRQNLRLLCQSLAHLDEVFEVMDRFLPDVALTDYEHWVPRAARKVGLPCLSIDHQHVITLCRHSLPWSQYPSYLGTGLSVRLLFSRATDYLVISFFQPPVRGGRKRVRVLPPLLRDQVMARQPTVGEHVVAYHSYDTFPDFFTFLQAIPGPVMVYGSERDGVEGNLTFKKRSVEGFLDDLAGCRYLVCGGNHTMISEALYYGKPMLSFPIHGAFEQFLNAWYLERQGYGRMVASLHPSPDLIRAFEARLPDYAQAVRQANFCGNAEVFAAVEEFIRQARLPETLPAQAEG